MDKNALIALFAGAIVLIGSNSAEAKAAKPVKVATHGGEYDLKWYEDPIGSIIYAKDVARIREVATEAAKIAVELRPYLPNRPTVAVAFADFNRR